MKTTSRVLAGTGGAIAANSSTKRPMKPDQLSVWAVPAASSICRMASDPVGPMRLINSPVRLSTAADLSTKSEAIWIDSKSSGAMEKMA